MGLSSTKATDDAVSFFLNHSFRSNGVFEARLSDKLERDFSIQASTNAVDWITLTNQSTPGGSLEFNDPNAGVFSHRFYRALTMDPALKDAPVIQFPALCLTVDESAGMIQVPVHRLGSTNETVQVSFAMTNFTATAGQDYSAPGGILEFVAGVTEAFISVTISEDEDEEGDETAVLVLSNPGPGAKLGPNAALGVVIADNESNLRTLVSCVDFIPSTVEGSLSSSLVLSSTNLFWSEGGDVRVWKAPTNGGLPQPLVHRLQYPASMAARDGDLFAMDLRSGFASSGCNGTEVLRAILRMKQDGSGARVLIEVDDCLGSPRDLLVDRSHLFFANSSSVSNLYYIQKMSIDGGAPEILASTSIQLQALAMDATHIYWAESRYPDPVDRRPHGT